MRRKPVTRDEIRFNGSRITTLPIDTVREGEYHPEPIKALWAPLLRSLNRAQKKDWDNRLGIRKNFARSGWRGGFKAPEPITLLNSPAGSGWSRHVQKPEQRLAQAASARTRAAASRSRRSVRRDASAAATAGSPLSVTLMVSAPAALATVSVTGSIRRVV